MHLEAAAIIFLCHSLNAMIVFLMASEERKFRYKLDEVAQGQRDISKSAIIQCASAKNNYNNAFVPLLFI